MIQPVVKSQRLLLARDAEAMLDEAVGLARAIDLEIAGRDITMLSQIRPSTYIGGGLAEELKETIQQDGIKLLFVNTALSAGQQRNLENICKCKVIDRTGMILEIFGARAHTHEGALQVELASLQFQRSRLVRSWTHLERQRGGFGFLGGPGEKQLEMDRRLLEKRIERIKKELSNVTRTRRMQRSARKRNEVPTIALVGYTNAGKSTLFNHLTQANVMAKDMLFATLDPTVRPCALPSGRKILLSDTVGFIADLPTQLIAAFRATLEEVEQADILLHVRDMASSEAEEQKKDVEHVLAELGIDDTFLQKNCIEIWNKTDLLPPGAQEELRRSAQSVEDRQTVLLSAKTGQGIDALLALIEEKLNSGVKEHILSLPQSAGAAIAWLYRNAVVLERRDGAEFCRLKLLMNPSAQAQFSAQFGQFLRKNKGKAAQKNTKL